MTTPPDPAELETADAAISSLLEDADVDSDVGPFEAPWQARAFAMAVALTETADHDWAAFQNRFVERVEAADPATMQADVEGVYYRAWMGALEDLLVDRDVVTAGELDERQAEFADGDRDESEFVRTGDFGQDERSVPGNG